MTGTCFLYRCVGTALLLLLRRWTQLPLDSIESELTKSTTGYEGLRLQQAPPAFADIDDLLRLLFGFCRMSLLLCMLDDGLSILRINCVQDIEEVGAVDSPASRHVVREEACELGVICHLRPKVLQ